MKNQKICIIGGGLAGLTTAMVLKNLNLDIDIFFRKKDVQKSKDERSTAISNSSFVFLKKSFEKIEKNIFWSCNKISLFHENENENKKLNFLNFEEKKSYLMHIFKNKKYKNYLIKNLRGKNLRIINKNVTEINSKEGFIKSNKTKYRYDLIILCLGAQSNLYKNIIGERSIKKNYKEISLTGNIGSNFNILNPVQYFSKEGPLAILPYEKKKFSFVWSISQDLFLNNKKNIRELIKKKIKVVLKNKKNFKILNNQFYSLYLNLKSKYFKKNVVILGDGLHTIHPIAGQGFNLVLRDIKKLSEILKNHLDLGLSIKNSLVFKNFFNARKAENIFFGLGVDLTRIFFKKNKTFEPFQNILLKNISRYKVVQKISKIIADKGLF